MCDRAWKSHSRKLSRELLPHTRREKALDMLLSLDKPTKNAIPYKDWETPIHIVWGS